MTTCGRCGEEVRYGVRDIGRGPQKGYWHRVEKDHPVTLGVTMSYEESLAYFTAYKDRGSEEAVVEPIPAPEVYSTPIEPPDPRLPGGAKQILNLARKHDWRAWATYSRGPRTHASHGTLLGVSDFVVIRMRLDGDRPGAVASWVDGKFDHAWLCEVDTPKRKIIIVGQANSDQLKAWIRRDEGE